MCLQELRAQRLARTQARMQEQLAEKQARDAKEEADRSNKGDLRTAVRPRMDAWLAGKKVHARVTPHAERHRSLFLLRTRLLGCSAAQPPTRTHVTQLKSVANVVCGSCT